MKNKNPKFITLSYQAAQIANFSAISGLFAATTFLIGTPFNMNAATALFGFVMYQKYKRPSPITFDPQCEENIWVKDKVQEFTAKAGLEKEPALSFCSTVPAKIEWANNGQTILYFDSEYIYVAGKKNMAALLAHEISHAKAGHLNLILFEKSLTSLAICETFFHVAESLFSGKLSHVGMALFSVAAVQAATITMGISSYVAREFQADQGAALLTKDPQAMIDGLKIAYDLQAKKAAPETSWVGRTHRALGEKIFSARLSHLRAIGRKHQFG